MFLTFALPMALVWFPVSRPDIHADLVAIRPMLTACLVAMVLSLYLVRQWPAVRVVAIGSGCLMAVLFVCVFAALRPRYDLERVSRLVDQAQDAGRPVAYVGYYQAEFGFLGRLTEPVASIEVAKIDEWRRANPDGMLIGRSKRLRAPELAVVYRQPYRSDELLVVDWSKVSVPSLTGDSEAQR